MAKGMGLPILDHMSTAVVLGVVSSLSLYIFVRFVQGCKKELAAKKANA
jgi:hypothetical protein